MCRAIYRGAGFNGPSAHQTPPAGSFGDAADKRSGPEHPTMTRGKAPRSLSKVSSASGAELLFEIGVEELPYQVIAAARSSLEEQAAFQFGFYGLSSGSIKAYGTPRRLVLEVERLATFTKSKDVTGPSKSVAF